MSATVIGDIRIAATLIKGVAFYTTWVNSWDIKDRSNRSYRPLFFGDLAHTLAVAAQMVSDSIDGIIQTENDRPEGMLQLWQQALSSPHTLVIEDKLNCQYSDSLPQCEAVTGLLSQYGIRAGQDGFSIDVEKTPEALQALLLLEDDAIPYGIRLWSITPWVFDWDDSMVSCAYDPAPRAFDEVLPEVIAIASDFYPHYRIFEDGAWRYIGHNLTGYLFRKYCLAAEINQPGCLESGLQACMAWVLAAKKPDDSFLVKIVKNEEDDFLASQFNALAEELGLSSDTKEISIKANALNPRQASHLGLLNKNVTVLRV